MPRAHIFAQDKTRAGGHGGRQDQTVPEMVGANSSKPNGREDDIASNIDDSCAAQCTENCGRLRFGKRARDFPCHDDHEFGEHLRAERQRIGFESIQNQFRRNLLFLRMGSVECIDENVGVYKGDVRQFCKFPRGATGVSRHGRASAASIGRAPEYPARGRFRESLRLSKTHAPSGSASSDGVAPSLAPDAGDLPPNSSLNFASISRNQFSTYYVKSQMVHPRLSSP